MELVTFDCKKCGNNLKFEANQQTVTCKCCDTTYLVVDNLQKVNNSIQEDREAAEELIRIFGYRDMFMQKVYEKEKKLSKVIDELNLKNVEIRYSNYYKKYNDSKSEFHYDRVNFPAKYADYYLESEMSIARNTEMSSAAFENGKNPYMEMLNSTLEKYNYDELKEQVDTLLAKRQEIYNIMKKNVFGIGKKYQELDNQAGELSHEIYKIENLLASIDKLKELAFYYENLSPEEKETFYEYLYGIEMLMVMNEKIDDLRRIAEKCLDKIGSNDIYKLNFDLIADVNVINKYNVNKEYLYEMFSNLGINLTEQDRKNHDDRQIA